MEQILEKKLAKKKKAKKRFTDTDEAVIILQKELEEERDKSKRAEEMLASFKASALSLLITVPHFNLWMIHVIWNVQHRRLGYVSTPGKLTALCNRPISEKDISRPQY